MDQSGPEDTAHLRLHPLAKINWTTGQNVTLHIKDFNLTAMSQAGHSGVVKRPQ